MTDFNPPSSVVSLFRSRCARTAVALTLGLSPASSARAETPPPAADAQLLADTLFRAGRQLMDQGAYAEACRKLEESYRLDAAPGTLLALATCHEQEGRVAKAWGEFNQSLATARRDGRADREKFAKEHVTALEGVLPKVVIDVPEDARAVGLAVTRNGSALTETSWGVPLPSDPGDVVVKATAPGHAPWSQTVNVSKGQTVRVLVPRLEVVVERAPQVVPEVSRPVPAVADAGGRKPSEGVHDYRVAAYVAGAVGVVGLGVGTYFGLHALAKQQDSDSACPTVAGVRQCTQAGVDASSSAVTNARLSDVTLGVGIAGVVTGAVLFLVSSKGAGGETSPAGAQQQIRLVPSFARDGGGLAVIGAF